ncbi:MAG: tRNA pseudouridine55 synthase [Crocinitomicaceae bacterium]|jgi:tRNA pseudouridine55 synthase
MICLWYSRQSMNKPKAKNYFEPDILLVHKPVGISSFDVIRRLRVILGIRKIGHAGTLDPLAHGLMIVGIGTGTKKLTDYLKQDKTYIAEILVGKSTTTGDLEGEIVKEVYVEKTDMNSSNIEMELIHMKGSHTLQVPLYSAIKVQGKALYAYARAGQKPPYIPEKEMNIKSIQYMDDYRSGKYHIIQVRLNVSSGSYIRTLGEEFGRRVGYPATLKGLYRISIGEHLDKNAYHFPSRKKPYHGIVRAIIELLFGKKSK